MHTGADTDDRGAWDAGTSSPASLAQCRGRTLLWAAEKLDLQFLKGRGDAAHIVLVGCDGREGTTIREVRACLQEVIDHAASVAAPSLLLTLVGPHVPAHLDGVSEEFAEPSASVVTISCFKMSYELWWDISMRPGDAPQRTPDLIACFNAGVWGYSEWQPAVKLMLQHSGKSPVVFTAYNALECDADEEVVDRVAAGIATEKGAEVGTGEPWYAWNATRNPWRSLAPRPSSMHPGETLFESYYCFALRWQDQNQPA